MPDMSDLGDALRRADSKKLRDSLTAAAQRQAAADLGMNWRGDWSATVRYRPGDVVHHDCGGFTCVREHTGKEPPAETFWAVLACKGEKGEKGDRGNTGMGMAGPPGPGSDLDIQDEGIAQGVATVLDFVGAGVTATVAAGTATITIPGGGGSPSIPQYDVDPAANPEDAWVLRTPGPVVGGGEIKFLFGGGTAITDTGAGTSTYEFSYRTLQNTTVRVALT